jgi:hypothetical protein
MIAERKRSRSYPVFAAAGGRKVIDRATLSQAEMFERREIWRREYDTVSGSMIGFRVVGVEVNKKDGDLRTMQSSATITAAEMDLNLERSRTHGLREPDREARIKYGLDPEDRVERVKAKVRVFAVITPAKGDILRVWPK